MTFLFGGVWKLPPPLPKKRASHTYIIMSSLFNQICNTNSSIVTNVKLLLLKPPFFSLYIVKGLFGAVFSVSISTVHKSSRGHVSYTNLLIRSVRSFSRLLDTNKHITNRQTLKPVNYIKRWNILYNNSI